MELQSTQAVSYVCQTKKSAHRASSLNAIAGAYSHLRRAWRLWLEALTARRNRKRTARLLSEYDDHVLQDLAVPAPLLEESRALRQREDQRRRCWLQFPG